MNTHTHWHHDEDIYAMALAASARRTREAMDARKLNDATCSPASITGGRRNPVTIARRIDAAIAAMTPGDECTVSGVMALIECRNRGRVREALARLIVEGKLIGTGGAARRYGSAGTPSHKAYRVVG